jgi:hypothetical protein
MSFAPMPALAIPRILRDEKTKWQATLIKLKAASTKRGKAKRKVS